MAAANLYVQSLVRGDCDVCRDLSASPRESVVAVRVRRGVSIVGAAGPGCDDVKGGNTWRDHERLLATRVAERRAGCLHQRGSAHLDSQRR